MPFLSAASKESQSIAKSVLQFALEDNPESLIVTAVGSTVAGFNNKGNFLSNALSTLPKKK